MSDSQIGYWNKWQVKMATRIKEPSDFTSKVLPRLRPEDKLLELGCGTGIDASYFASNGINTIATDFADQTIRLNVSKYENKKLVFKLLDTNSAYPFKSNEFECVYACLSLHYFTDANTQNIFKEIRRVLKSDGLFAFRCKSISDPYYGKGKKIEKDMFDLNGHVRHLFSMEYSKSLLGDFMIIELEEKIGVYDGESSMFIDCLARKI